MPVTVDDSSPTQVFIDAHIANLCETAEAIHVQRQAGTQGGVLIRTSSALTGKLNRAVGSGKQGALDNADLEKVESIFGVIGLGAEIHLSPFASAATIQTLLSRGYVNWGRLHTYWCRVDGPPADHATGTRKAEPGHVVTRTVQSSEIEQFVQASVAGFEDGGRSPALLRTVAGIAASRPDTTLYLAEVDGHVAGGAAMAIIETADGSVAHLYLDSTIPRHRGRGVHQALIHARLHDAHHSGISVASMITRPGSGSARNAERAGLSLAYTTSVFHLDRRS
ncbi:hypothetical protein N7468_009710 [Penicillium chermesinum]|uniref:N-acetyltransferase domain-containing protein n=1 Tax=Penicillium chermesinum TaxID=63820 RepID=A0A9W9TF90_9EURO|nr:uncharacterized protein N7468_009710 [Penicillium chermesinum]KAJ5220506.1 hypothetical protein N7468_009710 [Penicillium chermesinum]